MAVAFDIETVSSTGSRFPDLVELFEAYRDDFGCDPDRDRAATWLGDHLGTGALTAYLAIATRTEAAVGMALVMRSPASLALGCFWAVRDLYVATAHRGQGAGRSLLDAIAADARADGALRIGLQTDDRDTPARRLYEHYGFTRVENIVQLTFDLRNAEQMP